MTLRKLTYKQVLEETFAGTTCFYMAARAMEDVCDSFNGSDDDLREDERRTPEKSYTYWLTPDLDLIASAITGFGPREPDMVWDGALHEDWHDASWICSEDEMSQEQINLMDRVAKHCPGGLGGWS